MEARNECIKLVIKLDESTEIIASGKIDNYFDVLSCSVSEELAYKDGTPLGCVSSNSLKFQLSNPQGELCPDNSDSQYFGKLCEGVEVDVYVEKGTDWLPFGVYFVKSWSDGVGEYGSAPVDVVCVDWIGRHKDDSVVIQEVTNNSDVKSFLKIVFNSQGLSDDKFSINMSRSQLIDFGVLNGGSFGKVLSAIASGLCCYIFCDRLGVLNVVDVGLVGNSVATVSGDSLVYKARRNDELKSFGSVCVTYKGFTKSEKKSLLRLENVTLSVGDNNFKGVEVASNMYVISTIQVSGDCDVDGISYSKNRVSFNIKSTTEQVVNVEVFGCDLIEGKFEYIENVNNSKSDVYSVESDLIQKEEYAVTIARKLSSIIENSSMIELSTCVSPFVRVGDCIRVDVKSLKVLGTFKVIGTMMMFGSSFRNVLTLLRVGD